MALKLMYITNQPRVAEIAQAAGVDRVWVDLEYIGKAQRQGGMDTVQSRHTVEDIRRVGAVLTASQLMVRVNPIHEATAEYTSSEEEIEAALANGAKVLMLPYFKTLREARRFLDCVDGRAVTSLLVETPEAVELLDDILRLKGIDEIHIGLNDLSLGYGLPFMFQLLSDGTVERLSQKVRAAGIAFGFGGVGRPGSGTLPAEYILGEHVRLGSEAVILSRSFCNADKASGPDEIERAFREGVPDIRRVERECQGWTPAQLEENRQRVAACVDQIIAGKQS